MFVLTMATDYSTSYNILLILPLSISIQPCKPILRRLKPVSLVVFRILALNDMECVDNAPLLAQILLALVK